MTHHCAEDPNFKHEDVELKLYFNLANMINRVSQELDDLEIQLGLLKQKHISVCELVPVGNNCNRCLSQE